MRRSAGGSFEPLKILYSLEARDSLNAPERGRVVRTRQQPAEGRVIMKKSQCAGAREGRSNGSRVVWVGDPPTESQCAGAREGRSNAVESLPPCVAFLVSMRRSAGGSFELINFFRHFFTCQVSMRRSAGGSFELFDIATSAEVVVVSMRRSAGGSFELHSKNFSLRHRPVSMRRSAGGSFELNTTLTG